MRTRHRQLLFGLFLIAAASIAHAEQPASAPAKKDSESKEARRARQKASPTTAKSDTQPNWIITEFHSDAPGNVFYNTEAVKLALTLGAKDAQKPLTIKGGTWRIKEIEDQEKWPHDAQDHRFKETDAVSGEGSVAAQSGQKIPLTIEWKPTRLGAFGVYLKLDDGSGADEQMVWGFVVGYPPVPGPKPDSPVIFNLQGKDIVWLGAAHKRLGVKWVRGETGWGQNEPRPGEWTWEATDEWVKAAKDNDLFIMDIMAHAPSWALPKIEGRIPIYYWLNRPETNVTPQYLPQWQEWVRRFVDRYKETVRVGVVLNEPWEGGSLSGWHGSGAHYREILKSFSTGARAADPTFKVLANDSGMNVEDNILTAPGAIDLIDAVSVHTYRSYNAFYMPQYAAYGKPVWDTESWIGVGASSLVQQVAFQLAQGFVKVQPVSTPFAWMDFKQPKPRQPKPVKNPKQTDTAPAPTSAAPTPTYAAPTAQALGVLLHFIEDTEFYREARPESLPWMFVFRGRKNGPTPDKNAAVILGRDNRWDNFPWYRIKSDGELTIPDPDRVLTAYDAKGNALTRTGPSLHVPLTISVYYVVSSKGADDLVQHLRDATVRGLEPVQIALRDFTQPLSQNPPLRVRLTNAYNVPVSGSVEVKAPAGWNMAGASKPFADLKPGETAELSFGVTKTQPLPINRYPFTITAKTDKGNAELSEELSAALLVKGTPSLDGTAEDWQKLGALPVYLSGDKTPVDSFVQYTMPFLNLQEKDNTGYIVQFMAMWDDRNFYVLADINDSTEKLRPSMEKGTWFTMHAAPNEWEYWGPHSIPATGGDMFNFAFNVLPYGEKQIANFPPAAQKKVEPRWQVNIADYEYSLYLGKQNKLPPGDYQQAVDELKKSGLKNHGLRPPQFEKANSPAPEVWRLMAPGLARHNYFPFSPRAEKDQGLVPGARLNVTREGNVWHYRAAIPWSELSLVKPLAMEGRPVKFSFLGKNDGRTAVSWSNASRSIARGGQEIMHPTWELNWSPDTEWGFVDLTTTPKP